MKKIQQQFNAVYKKSGKWYLGWVEEVPGVNTQGKTLKAVRENLKEALLLILEANKTLNQVSFGKEKIIREPISLTR